MCEQVDLQCLGYPLQHGPSLPLLVWVEAWVVALFLFKYVLFSTGLRIESRVSHMLGKGFRRMLYPSWALVLRINITVLFTHTSHWWLKSFLKGVFVVSMESMEYIPWLHKGAGSVTQCDSLKKMKLCDLSYHGLDKAKNKRANSWLLAVATRGRHLNGPEDDGVTHDFIILTKTRELIHYLEQNVEFQMMLSDWLLKISRGLMALSEGLQEQRILGSYHQGRAWLVLVSEAQLGQWLPAARC